MLNRLNISILLITGYSPRQNALIDLLQGVCGTDATISSVPSTSQISQISDEPELFLLDLANIKEPSLDVIRKVKEQFTESKIIALHIYSSSMLVEPLFNAGIDGYLTYEPTRFSINKALECVLSNETYMPEDVLSS